MAKLLGVIAGGITLFFIVVMMQMIAPFFHPVAPGSDPGNSEAVADWLSTAPFGVQLMIAVMWFVGALGGGWIAQRISDWRPAVWIIVGASAIVALASTERIGQLDWLQLLIVAGPLIAGLLVTRYLTRAVRTDPDLLPEDGTINA